jgi:sirohydrochlorin ferrochelatase
MAESHERIARLYRRHAADPRESARYNNEQAALYARAAGSERAEAERTARRGEAFRNAARYPWVSVPPDEADPLGASLIDREEQLKKLEIQESNKPPPVVLRPRR